MSSSTEYSASDFVTFPDSVYYSTNETSHVIDDGTDSDSMLQSIENMRQLLDPQKIGTFIYTYISYIPYIYSFVIATLTNEDSQNIDDEIIRLRQEIHEIMRQQLLKHFANKGIEVDLNILNKKRKRERETLIEEEKIW
jgi:hypothetical protein